MFPSATDVIRVGDARWEGTHDEWLQALLLSLRDVLRGSRDIEEGKQRLSKHNPRIPVGDDSYAYLLWGVPDLVGVVTTKWKANINGLVIEPRTRMRISRRGKVVVDF